MKKILVVLLVTTLTFTGGLVTVFADDANAGEQPIHKIEIKKICTMLWAGEKPQFSVEIDPEFLEKINVVSEKWIGPENELTVSGKNLAVAGGKYRYELKLSAKDGFYFDNDLEINYQGIDGKYQLQYFFPPGEDTNHTMIVTGDFDNIIAASPLIDKIDIGKVLALVISGKYTQAIDFVLDDGVPFSKKATVKDGSWNHVSGDKYSYKLVLETKKGFTFSNKLKFLYDENEYGYSIDYKYDLSSNKHTLKIQGYAEEKKDVKPGTSAAIAEKVITGTKTEEDTAGAAYTKLRLRSPKQTSKSITLKWVKPKGAVKYVIYGSRCGKTRKLKKIATIKDAKKTSKVFKKVGGKKIIKGKYYKFTVVALDKNNKVVSTSKMIHVAAKGDKFCNHKSVKVSKDVTTKAKKLKKGNTLKIGARTVAQSKNLKVKKHVGLRYASTSRSIATVSKSGKITAKKKGTCYIYVYAQNGVHKRIKVVVK